MGFKQSITPIYKKNKDGHKVLIGYKTNGPTETQLKNNTRPTQLSQFIRIIITEEDKKKAEDELSNKVNYKGTKCFIPEEDIMKKNKGPKSVQKRVAISKWSKKRDPPQQG